LHSTARTCSSISNFGEKTLEEVYIALEQIGFYRKTKREAAFGLSAAARLPEPTLAASARSR